MKKLLLLIMCLIFLFGCQTHSPDDYQIISDNPVDGYDIYQLVHQGFMCNDEYRDIYYSDASYNYGFSFQGCSPDMTFFVKHEGTYVYLKSALEQGLLSIESLLPELTPYEREPEAIASDETDYYWLDFYIMGQVVYAYAGGPCDQAGTEVFVINGTLYAYEATGCLENNILFMEVDHEYVAVAQLLQEGKIDGVYLIPLLQPIP